MTVQSALDRHRSIDPRLLLLAAGVGVAATVNWLVARASTRRHPPTGHFVKVGGTNLHYLDEGPRQSDHSPVVLLHGNGITSHEFVDSGLVGLLARERRVLVFDRPGAGHSERPRDTIWTARGQARLLRDALREIGIERPIVVGHSWGTLVALAMAIEMRREVAGLVLLSGYYYPSLRAELPLFALPAIPLLGDLARYTIAPLLGWMVAPALIRKAFAPSPVPRSFGAASTSLALRPSQIRATAADAALMIPAAAELRRSYAGIEVPVAIIAGAGDKVVDISQSKRLHKDIKGSELHLVPREGHMLHHDNPELVAAAVDSVESRRGSENQDPRTATRSRSIPTSLRIRERANALWNESGEPVAAMPRFMEEATAAVRGEESSYDQTVADSFPASDPPANSGITRQ